MNNLYFIAGASGSGKTSIKQGLQEIYASSIKIYDFDEIGVPRGADARWRQESTEKWLQKLLQEKTSACLLGQIVLGEILACPSAKNINKIKICFLDVGDFERIQRLNKRNTYGADQNMLIWASWLRMHHQDPQWMQQVIKEQCWQGLEFNRWDKLENWDSKAAVEIVDTTGYTIKQVVLKVSDWINKEIHRTS